MAMTGQHPFASDVCRSLGLDPKLVRELTLTILVNDIAVVDVVMYPDESSIGDIAKLLDRRFRLVEVSEERPE